MKIVHRQSVVSAAAVIDGSHVDERGAFSILHARGDIKRRLSLISRRRRYARVRAAGHIFGWAAGVVMLLALVTSAAVGLR